MFRRLKEDIACILERDPAARSAFEVVTCYPGLHALWIQRMAHWCWVRGLRWPGRFLSHLGRFFTDERGEDRHHRLLSRSGDVCRSRVVAGQGDLGDRGG
jgi:hypothetical protein